MRSLCKSFIFLALVLFVPATFVGCGPSQVSDEEAAQTAEEEDAPEDMDVEPGEEPEESGAGDEDE